MNNPILLSYFEVLYHSSLADVIVGLSVEEYAADHAVGDYAGSIGILFNSRSSFTKVCADGFHNVHSWRALSFDTQSPTTTVGCGMVYSKERNINYVFFTREAVCSALFPIRTHTFCTLKPTISLVNNFAKCTLNVGETPFVFSNWSILSNINNLEIATIEFTGENHSNELEEFGCLVEEEE